LIFFDVKSSLLHNKHNSGRCVPPYVSNLLQHARNNDVDVCYYSLTMVNKKPSCRRQLGFLFNIVVAMIPDRTAS